MMRTLPWHYQQSTPPRLINPDPSHDLDHTSPDPPSDEPPDNPPDDTVGPDNVPGYGSVMTLAEFLVGLRDQTSALSRPQGQTIVKLWNALSDYDKRPTMFSPRHKDRLLQGRFKASKSSTATTVVPGKDSTARSFVGLGGAAAWPDANRYMEAIMIKLLAIYPSPTKKNGNTTLRWTLIMRAYKNIREAVLANAVVMDKTQIQLADVNTKTLALWYKNRTSRQEQVVLKQGINLSTPPTNPHPAMPARELPTVLDVGTNPERHQCSLPADTAGQSKERPPNSQMIKNPPRWQHPLCQFHHAT